MTIIRTLTKDPDSQHLGVSQTERAHGGHDSEVAVGMFSTVIAVATAAQRIGLMVEPCGGGS